MLTNVKKGINNGEYRSEAGDGLWSHPEGGSGTSPASTETYAGIILLQIPNIPMIMSPV